MEASIENQVQELVSRMAGFREKEPTETELRVFSEDYLTARRSLTSLDAALDKSYWYYQQFYADWLARHEEQRQERSKAQQIEIEF